jgi:hypothetical protein
VAQWANGHNGDIQRAAYGYEATREAAMAAFAKRCEENKKPRYKSGAKLRECTHEGYRRW